MLHAVTLASAGFQAVGAVWIQKNYKQIEIRETLL
jgi:hypothetical protein